MRVYLDNSATTRPRREVVDAIAEYSYESFGNPSSLHRMGLNIEKNLKKFRQNISNMLGCSPDELYFTSGGTEANNMAVHGIMSKFRNRKAHMICSNIEHASIMNIFKHYGLMDNFDVDYVEADESGIINPDKLKALLREDTAIVSIMMVNNEIGSIQPIKELVRVTKENSSKTVFHSDCVQAFGKLDIDVKDLGVDMVSISSHKVHSPKGTGAIYINKKVSINPLFQGGGQEKDIRPGTENTPGIFGFSKASSIMEQKKAEERLHMRAIKRHAVKKITEEIDNIKINSPICESNIDNILNISIRGIKAEILLHTLEEKEIYLSTGSACSSKSKNKSHVLKAIGLTDEEIEGSVRISFSYENTEEEISYFVEQLKEAVEDIRMILSL